jgi:Sulfotransferase family
MAAVRKEPDAARRPVFLVGCHRSGSTLARYLFDTHPNLACPPESKFIAGLKAFYDYPQCRRALLSLGLSDDDVLRELRRMVERILGGYARRQSKPRWIDKTPNYFRLLPFLDAVFGGEPLYLLITRHPLDCVDSLYRFQATRRQYPDPEIRRSVRLHGRGFDGWACYWNEVYGRIHEFSSSCPERCHLFRYEDLVRRPTATLRRALGFIGESLPPNLVRSAFAAPHAAGYEDPGIRETSGVETDHMSKWRAWPGNRIAKLWAIVEPTAELYGYSVRKIAGAKE